MWDSPREIRQGEEIAWYADGDTIVRNEYNPSIAYAYGKIYAELIFVVRIFVVYIYSFGSEVEGET